MSAYAVPIDWRANRVLYTVRGSNAWNIPQLAEDLGLDIEDTQALMVHVGQQIGMPIEFVDTAAVVLH